MKAGVHIRKNAMRVYVHTRTWPHIKLPNIGRNFYYRYERCEQKVNNHINQNSLFYIESSICAFPSSSSSCHPSVFPQLWQDDSAIISHSKSIDKVSGSVERRLFLYSMRSLCIVFWMLSSASPVDCWCPVLSCADPLPYVHYNSACS